MQPTAGSQQNALQNARAHFPVIIQLEITCVRGMCAHFAHIVVEVGGCDGQTTSLICPVHAEIVVLMITPHYDSRNAALLSNQRTNKQAKTATQNT